MATVNPSRNGGAARRRGSQHVDVRKTRLPVLVWAHSLGRTAEEGTFWDFPKPFGISPTQAHPPSPSLLSQAQSHPEKSI